MQQSRESGGLRQKLGTFFGISSGSSRPEEQWSQDSVFVFTEDVLKEIGPGNPIQVRIKMLKELQDSVANKRLEQYAIQRLWKSIKDLLDPSVPMETRHYVLGFIRSLIGGQYEELGMLRSHFLSVINEHNLREDFQPCFDVVRTLTDSGKDIVYLEQEMGPYLARIITRAMGSGRSIEYLTMVLNVIKHNAAYLDEDVLMKIIEGCCHCATIASSQLAVTELCLEALNAIVCYSTLPSSALSNFIITLCHTLNLSKLSKQSYEMMMRLFGTHIGMATIYTLCTILQDKSNWGNPLLLRGGVFYISMSLWGVRRVESLKVSYGSVLPAIRQASLCDHTIVIYEITLSILRLVRAYSDTLQSMEWDLVYDIISNMKEHVRQLKLKEDTQLLQVFHDIFATVSDYHSSVDYANSRVNPKRFYEVVGHNASVHDLPMVMKLLMYHATSIKIGEPGWVEQYKEFMERFYVTETETTVRIEALNQLDNVILLYSVTYEDELLRDVVLPLLSPIAQDTDSEICCKGVQLLITVLNECSPSWTPPTLGIINNVLQRGLELAMRANNTSEEEFKLSAVKASILGLAPLIKSKLPRSSDVAVQVFQLLVTYLLQLYEENVIIPATSIIRIEIINCLLSLRGNEEGFVGYHDKTGTTYSSFYVCQRPFSEEGIANTVVEEEGPMPNDSLTSPITYLDYSKVAHCVLICLAKECEWEVIVELLIGLRGVLENRTIVVSSWSDFSSICCKLCAIANSQSDWLKDLNNVPNHKHVDSLSNYLYPVLASLCSYGNVLNKDSQHQLVCSLERGVVKQCGLLCVRALSVAVLEMQATMTRLLPRVLYKLGQVAATPTMTLPVLELLSNVVSLPVLYRGFVEQQYLSVFGIVLLYTDPFKYNSYVVTLAYHVISIWFLRCRIQYRPTVAQFINKQLSTILSVYEEVHSPTVTTTTNESRKRSSSFNASHPQSINRQRSQTHVGSGSSHHSGKENSLLKEMIELCIDMMARYTYSNISTQPIRSSGADFLVGNGPSKTWLLGNSLVTITTSGTGGGSQNVCPRCRALQQSLKPNPDDLVASNESFMTHFRRMSLSSEVEHETTPPICSCWCRGWSEVKVRRPTGNVAWLMRVQNKLDILATDQTQSTTPDPQFDWSLTAINNSTAGGDDDQEPAQSTLEDQWDMIDPLEGDLKSTEQSADLSLDPTSIAESRESHDLQSHDLQSSHDSSLVKTKPNSSVTLSNPPDLRSHDLQPSLALEMKPTCNSSVTLSNQSPDHQQESCDPQDESPDHQRHSCDQRSKSPDQQEELHVFDQMEDQVDEEETDGKDIDRISAVKLIASSTTRQPSSHSWSEGGSTGGGDIPATTSSTTTADTMESKVSFRQRMYTTRSYSFTGSSIELLPPLFSYDESNPTSRSPSLVRDDEVLSDPEQLQLIRRASKSLSESSKVDDELELSLPKTESESGTGEPPTDQDEAPTDTTKRNTESPTEEKLSNILLSTSGNHSDSPLITVTPPRSLVTAPAPNKTSVTTPPTSAPRKRVKFSNPPAANVTHKLREELPADVYNNPSFIFLQLYHSSSLGVHSPDPPILLPVSESVERAIKVMDHIPPYNTHKIGVVYVGPDQKSEQDILFNTYGSSRYQKFIESLGQLIQLKECTSNLVYLGGLDTLGTDGAVACFWEDDITQVIFHVATLMPSHPSNPTCSNKKLHIGNDFVTIVYNDSGEKYKFGTIKGQFNYAEVIIEPLGGGVNQVYLSVKDSLVNMLDSTPFLVSDRMLSLLTRQKAILANLASLVLLSENSPDNYPSNWLGRLRQIKRMRERTSEQIQSTTGTGGVGTVGSGGTTYDKKERPLSTQTTLQDFVPYC